MKFKVKFNESNACHFIHVKRKEDFQKYLKEHMEIIKEISPLNESVKVTPELIDVAWKDLKSRARKNHFISTQAMEAVCHKYSQYSEWDDEKGTDVMAFDKIWDLLIDQMDMEGYELLEASEYDKKFGLNPGPQTSIDVQMNKLRNKRNAMFRESKK